MHKVSARAHQMLETLDDVEEAKAIELALLIRAAETDEELLAAVVGAGMYLNQINHKGVC